MEGGCTGGEKDFAVVDCCCWVRDNAAGALCCEGTMLPLCLGMAWEDGWVRADIGLLERRPFCCCTAGGGGGGVEEGGMAGVDLCCCERG